MLPTVSPEKAASSAIISNGGYDPCNLGVKAFLNSTGIFKDEKVKHYLVQACKDSDTTITTRTTPTMTTMRSQHNTQRQ